jgi:hypothetical protein
MGDTIKGDYLHPWQGSHSLPDASIPAPRAVQVTHAVKLKSGTPV